LTTICIERIVDVLKYGKKSVRDVTTWRHLTTWRHQKLAQRLYSLGF